ncbi:pyridine nucleotide-disulfide oxidoreductase [Williamsia phyllosphaerae]|uniref:Pyridine nucleotide-disulfide oxidoreductase n=1 Tax=Williamsia phyllosphaerae TaxID=885042 RepID=A0ABQ1V973_9NOCA|nr:pyridine nucleotide-disulfide oxidoreductase [Williamsia phyllosphaerae]
MLVAGLGDTGVLTAIHLARHVDVVGISAKPALVSGQELGRRLAHPDDWARDYRIGFDRFRGLDRIRTVHGSMTGVDLDERAVSVVLADGSSGIEPYDALVISTGVTNGFWRRPTLQSTAEVDSGLRAAHDRLASAGSVAVLGGGAAAVSTAANLAAAEPGRTIDLYYPGERALPAHHRRTWSRVERRLRSLGVGLHPGHRAVVPEGFSCDRITDSAVEWSTGQSPAHADAVVWAIGRVRPNTEWLPAELLDDDGFVRVGPDLSVPDRPGVFAVGDVAATDPLRGSARNRADRLLARNVRAHLAGRPLRRYRPRSRRWGSVLGAQADGLEVFTPSGHGVRFPLWSVERILQPWIVQRAIYGGVRRPSAALVTDPQVSDRARPARRDA